MRPLWRWKGARSRDAWQLQARPMGRVLWTSPFALKRPCVSFIPSLQSLKLSFQSPSHSLSLSLSLSLSHTRIHVRSHACAPHTMLRNNALILLLVFGIAVMASGKMEKVGTTGKNYKVKKSSGIVFCEYNGDFVRQIPVQSTFAVSLTPPPLSSLISRRRKFEPSLYRSGAATHRPSGRSGTTGARSTRDRSA